MNVMSTILGLNLDSLLPKKVYCNGCPLSQLTIHFSTMKGLVKQL
jgi:hypothetical protein